MGTPVDALAEAAVGAIRDRMVVGLGTGRAAARAIEALARRARDEKLALTCVATSRASDEQARSLGLQTVPMNGVERLDYLFDGADEVDEQLRMIKGRGGAMTREKIVARAASRRVYLVQSEKLVSRLGASAPLPVEVLAFGLASARAALNRLGLKGEVRTKDDGSTYLTDNGNPVIDAHLARTHDVEMLAAMLDGVPGVVGHGLFLHEADVVLIEDASGAITSRERS